MGNRLPRLAFDVDGVFANFTEGFMSKINDQFGTDYQPEQWTAYGNGKFVPPPFAQEHWDWGWANLPTWEHFWIDMNPYPGINFKNLDLGMATLIFNGYFITRRRDMGVGVVQDANAQTRIWFENHGVKNATSIIAHSGGEQRIPLLQLIGVDAYLEDFGHQFLEAREAGINAYLIDRPYNRDIDTPYRVSSVDEFVGRALGKVIDIHVMIQNTFNPMEVSHVAAVSN